MKKEAKLYLVKGSLFPGSVDEVKERVWALSGKQAKFFVFQRLRDHHPDLPVSSADWEVYDITPVSNPPKEIQLELGFD